MSEPAVLFERQDHIGLITLNRPDNRNSMTPELFGAFVDATARARAEDGLRCVVITGTGRCFSAGADFRSQIQTGDEATMAPHERSYAMYTPFLSVLDIEVPVVAALNGHAVGGGFGLALACDLRVANRDAKYGANFARLGLSAGMGISYILPRLVGPSRAAELLFTGRLYDGEEALAMGVVQGAEDPDDVLLAAMEWANAIAANAPIAVRLLKKTLYAGMGWDVRAAALEEARAQAVTIDTDDVQEGIRALLEKREPLFRGR